MTRAADSGAERPHPIHDDEVSDEVAKFAALAAYWWDPQGPMRPLHRINPVRLGFIRDTIDGSLSSRSAERVLDVGCGAGLVSEPLARLGFQVLGIDLAAPLIEVARHHAPADLPLRYEHTDVAACAEDRAGSFDAVLVLEVVEHVDDPAAFLGTAARLVKDDGVMVVSTINRTVKAWMQAIVGAEYLLGWLPRGTHSFQRFLTPAEIARALRPSHLSVEKIVGLGYQPLRDRWVLTTDPAVNYMMTLRKGGVK